MPLPKNRSRSVRKIKRRTPKGRSTIIYKRRIKGKVHSCGLCGTRLQGVTSEARKAHSMKVPMRKFGGNLCPGCSKRVIVISARLKEGSMKKEGVGVRMLKYVTVK